MWTLSITHNGQTLFYKAETAQSRAQLAEWLLKLMPTATIVNL